MRDQSTEQPTSGGFEERTAITDAENLRAHIGPIVPLAARKILAHLDHYARDFIALSPFLVLASMDSEGRADASPRGDAPGFVEVLDDHTLLIPDRRGNNRVDSFLNVLEQPGIGLLFFVPGIGETLRVNGRANLVTTPDLLASHVVQGRTPTTGLRVTVDEVFFHCAKPVIRSHLWDPETQVARAGFPSLGRILAEQSGAMSVDDAERSTAEGYRTRLY